MYSYNMKRVFREGLDVQKSLAAAPNPRMSPNAGRGVDGGGGGSGGDGGGGGGGGSGGGGGGGVGKVEGGGGVWATLVGRRIDTKRCRVVGKGAAAVRALGGGGGVGGGSASSGGGDHGGGGGNRGSGDERLSVRSIDALVHSMFVSQVGDEDGAVASAVATPQQQQQHLAAPSEVCRGPAAGAYTRPLLSSTSAISGH